MVTFAQLNNTVPASLNNLQDVWNNLDMLLESLEPRLRDEVIVPARQSQWKGTTADAAFGSMTRTANAITASSIMITAVRAQLQAAREDFADAKLKLESAKYAAKDLGIVLGPDGSMQADPAVFPPSHPGAANSAESTMNDLSNRITEALNLAATADNNAVSALRSLAADTMDADPTAAEVVWATGQARGALDLDLSAMPKDPKGAADWWKGLTPMEQELYMEAYPREIGAKDGLPAGVRDESNRIALNADIAQQQAKVNATTNPDDKAKAQRELDNLNKVQSNLDKYNDRSPDRQAMLLSYDPGGEGKVVMAIGNPDTAKNVGVYVPGTGAGIDNMDGDLSRTDKLQKNSDGLTPSTPGDSAQILWIGYDAPNEVVPNAISDKYAEDGAPALDSFINGQRANRDDQHVTVIAHSYGSTLVGDAARNGDGLAVNDIVVAGSPGMHVNSADDLNIDSRHVWALDAPGTGSGADIIGDPVPDTRSHGEPGTFKVDVPLLPDPSLPGVLVPTDESFGANKVSSTPGGHSDYWNEVDGEPNESLANQARIIMGDYGAVSLDHGSPPK